MRERSWRSWRRSREPSGRGTGVQRPAYPSIGQMRALGDIIGQVLDAIWAHKLRSFLTMFGIAWGVGSLLLLIGLGEGFRSGQRRQMATLGNDVIFLSGGNVPAA